jgi:ribonuclease-3
VTLNKSLNNKKHLSALDLLSKTQIDFFKSLNIEFHDFTVLLECLTHTSYINEHPNESIFSNERLEFFGDSVLMLVISDYLFNRFQDFNEGDLTAWRSHLVNGKTLSEIAKNIGLGKCILLGKGEDNDAGRNNISILEGTLEALIAAIYLNTDYETTKYFILFILKDEIKKLENEEIIIDSKGDLQKYFQSFNLMPEYILKSTSGPEHSPTYKIEIIMPDGITIFANGKNIQDAEKNAALKALEILR